MNINKSSKEDVDNLIKVETHVAIPHGGTRTGLFRTPISGGVQSATSAHGLPRPALAVRNLMEQVKAILISKYCHILKNEKKKNPFFFLLPCVSFPVLLYLIVLNCWPL